MHVEPRGKLGWLWCSLGLASTSIPAKRRLSLSCILASKNTCTLTNGVQRLARLRRLTLYFRRRRLIHPSTCSFTTCSERGIAISRLWLLFFYGVKLPRSSCNRLRHRLGHGLGLYPSHIFYNLRATGTVQVLDMGNELQKSGFVDRALQGKRTSSSDASASDAAALPVKTTWACARCTFENKKGKLRH